MKESPAIYLLDEGNGVEIGFYGNKKGLKEYP
jgi:hypothetical protein